MTSLFVILLLESVSTGELLVILLAVFILFGPNKIPEIAKGLAKGIRDIRNASSEIQDKVNNTIDPIKKEIQSSIEQLKEEMDPNSKKTTDTKKPDFNNGEINKNISG